MAARNQYFNTQFQMTEIPLARDEGWEEDWSAEYGDVGRYEYMLVQHRAKVLLLAVIVVIPLTFFGLLRLNDGSGVEVASAVAAVETVVEPAGDGSSFQGGGAPPAVSGVLSPVFTREVRHWEAQIVSWAEQHGLDPNHVAIIMQVESCGDPNAVSSAGAQGLFQVMPFHFTSGENMQDPDTNARRGMAYFAEGLRLRNGDVGLAFAGYNGGHGTAAKSWSAWPNETQRYYNWTTGILEDIQGGLSESPTLNSWLEAGGAALCQQAAGRLGI